MDYLYCWLISFLSYQSPYYSDLHICTRPTPIRTHNYTYVRTNLPRRLDCKRHNPFYAQLPFSHPAHQERTKAVGSHLSLLKKIKKLGNSAEPLLRRTAPKRLTRTKSTNLQQKRAVSLSHPTNSENLTSIISTCAGATHPWQPWALVLPTGSTIQAGRSTQTHTTRLLGSDAVQIPSGLPCGPKSAAQRKVQLSTAHQPAAIRDETGVIKQLPLSPPSRLRFAVFRNAFRYTLSF